MPDNFADDYRMQPFGVRHYKELIDLNYGRVPDERIDLWLKRRNYLVNCMRLVDHEFGRVLAALDRLDRWKDTVVIFTGDHGEMNGAHRMTQKGAIHFDEVAIVNFTVRLPDGPRGRRTAAVGSHLDLAPTLLEFAGLSEDDMHTRYPQLKGRSLRAAILAPDSDGPRGSASAPGEGALLCWDGLHSLDKDWAITGALQAVTNLGVEEAVQEGEPRAVRGEVVPPDLVDAFDPIHRQLGEGFRQPFAFLLCDGPLEGLEGGVALRHHRPEPRREEPLGGYPGGAAERPHEAILSRRMNVLKNVCFLGVASLARGGGGSYLPRSRR